MALRPSSSSNLTSGVGGMPEPADFVQETRCGSSPSTPPFRRRRGKRNADLRSAAIAGIQQPDRAGGDVPRVLERFGARLRLDADSNRPSPRWSCRLRRALPTFPAAHDRLVRSGKIANGSDVVRDIVTDASHCPVSTPASIAHSRSGPTRRRRRSCTPSPTRSVPHRATFRCAQNRPVNSSRL